MQGSGTTTSVWMSASTSSMQAGPMPAGNADLAAEKPDVIVVGAGIAGVTTAYMLQRSGKRVLLLDDGAPGDGETGRTTAHLSNAIDDRYTETIRLHSESGARMAADSHSAAIDAIERLVREENIDCDFARLDGYLMLAPGQSPSTIDKELDAARRAGLEDVERMDHPPIHHSGPCLRFPRQGRFHALKYLAGLTRAFLARGGRLATHAHVSAVGQEGERAHVHVGPDHTTIEADAVVVATNSPISDRFAIHTKQAAYRTYAIAARVPKGAVPDGLYWDTLDSYHYVRLQPEGDHDLLIVGGEDHKTGEARDMDSRWAALETWTREHFPEAGAVEYRWSGQVMEPFDGLAFIGRDPAYGGRIFVATGDSGMGMTHGTIAGMVLCELIHGSGSPWAALYDPGRKMTSKLGTYLRENIDVGRQYLDYVRRSEVESEQSIAPGEGAVLKSGGKPIAVYRDESGALHRRSAVCPHLKCVVHWNPGEKSWDCPCHGSRFAVDGAVLNGPASQPLAEVEEPTRRTG
ncbi:FAD-dependent oxidoreductase [Azospirillum rugosum]|uniref:Glycine/D-amino acid oxidase-like deaminating enzyme/nitrite reductase/ring-hydroxylating ferredoxin subunit n=1 Tax=Azospirillum rugosum TaxID=416170 RepID=A0ABS4SKW0_9PROT|nr:FAD-dependent oxidoreductase [Azospirillum rugosum]MBP2293188.1 glycine/D-amino acid oxidase-like deaminating enzyme/nitrite reductase/ring-hydroxylating ferredoxin subunit [Azospirillum rugosum]MDQ0526737.1 glycine/D-amino acid oxidase-like deaminating enzyme/nitrite reductase/ring-hydroxylating ferredoxin subunit [Azospirillum rugosum]